MRCHVPQLAADVSCCRYLVLSIVEGCLPANRVYLVDLEVRSNATRAPRLHWSTIAAIFAIAAIVGTSWVCFKQLKQK
jgi:hypothetical protein